MAKISPIITRLASGLGSPGRAGPASASRVPVSTMGVPVFLSLQGLGRGITRTVALRPVQIGGFEAAQRFPAPAFEATQKDTLPQLLHHVKVVEEVVDRHQRGRGHLARPGRRPQGGAARAPAGGGAGGRGGGGGGGA